MVLVSLRWHRYKVYGKKNRLTLSYQYITPGAKTDGQGGFTILLRLSQSVERPSVFIFKMFFAVVPVNLTGDRASGVWSCCYGVTSVSVWFISLLE
jgi:hypothetical protein